MAPQPLSTVRPELVEGLPLLPATVQEEKGQGFDKLSPNGRSFSNASES